jgi:hypothetical protein
MIGWIIASLLNYLAAEINWRNGNRKVAVFYYIVAAGCAVASSLTE